MDILVVCSNGECGEIFSSPPDPPGGKAKCPACGKLTPVEPLEAPSKPSPESPTPTPVSKPHVQPQPRPVRQRPAHPALQLQAPPQAIADEAPAGPQADSSQPESSMQRTNVLESLTGGMAPPPEQNVFGYKTTAIALLLCSLLGMIAGAVGGVYATDNIIVGLYAGSALGWAAGFAAGMLLVLAVEHAEPPRLRCPMCRKVFPAGTESCTLCGSGLAEESADPLANECLAAGRYALSCRGSIAGMTALTVLTLAAVGGWDLLLRAYPAAMEQWKHLAAAWLAIWLLIAAAYCAEALAASARGALLRKGGAPHAPRLLDLANLRPLLRLVVAAVIYAASIVLLPLAPLALAGVGIAGALHPLRLGVLIQAGWRLAKDLTILWMVTLLYLAAMAVGSAVVGALQWGRSYLPVTAGGSGVAIAFSINLVLAALLAINVSIFALAIFRCAGLFARHNLRSLSLELRTAADTGGARAT